MPTTLFPKLVALLATLLLIGLGLTTYTLPNHAGPAYGDLRDLIGHTLGDRGPPLPGPSGALPITPMDSAFAPLASGQDAGAAAPPEPHEWVARAARLDSAALRDWLGDAVLATATVHGDTVRTTLWRLTLRHTCPLLSRMHAVSIGRTMGDTRIVSLSADCPVVPSEQSPR
jgi:hypothetical protein